jgi:Zn-dependent peptidase ImmA (M78 family)
MTVLDFKRDRRISQSDRTVLREFCTQLGGDPVTLANELGVVVCREDLSNEIAGYIEYDENCGSPSGYKIVVNGRHSLERQRFTVAHEVGHYVLHRETPEFRAKKRQSAEVFSFPSGYRSTDYWKQSDYPASFEREADQFAATVLLPVHLVRKTDEFLSGQPVALARRLGLSSTFVTIRFEEAYFDPKEQGGAAL